MSGSDDGGGELQGVSGAQRMNAQQALCSDPDRLDGEDFLPRGRQALEPPERDARLEGGLLARIGMAEGRLARLTLLGWAGLLAALVALAKL